MSTHFPELFELLNTYHLAMTRTCLRTAALTPLRPNARLVLDHLLSISEMDITIPHGPKPSRVLALYARVSHADIAFALNIPRTSVSRAISDLASAHVVFPEGHSRIRLSVQVVVDPNTAPPQP